MSAESREDERVRILGELQGEILVFQPMGVKEIGVRGATVETRTPLLLNSLHDVRLTLGERSIVLKGRVVHSCISDVDQDVVTYTSGMEFVEPTDRVSAVIEEFLAGVKADRQET